MKIKFSKATVLAVFLFCVIAAVYFQYLVTLI